MKFGTVTQLALYNGSTVKITNFRKFKMAAAAILKTTITKHDQNGLNDFHEICFYGDRVTLQTPLLTENSYFRKCKMSTGCC